MGGRVFKDEQGNCLAQRISKEDLPKLKERLNALWSDDNNTISVYPTELIKDSYGDIDLITDSYHTYDVECNLSGTHIDMFEYYKQKILKTFPNTKYIKKNGNIIHFLLDNKYQIDIIAVPYSVLETHRFYLSYGALGMISGIIARHLGLIFGQEGFKFRHSDVHITSTTKAIFLDVFKYDKHLYKKLEDNPTKENLFELIWSSPFMSLDVIDNSKASYSHRKREQDSPIFKEFFEWAKHKVENSTVEENEAKLKTAKDALPVTELDFEIYYKDVFEGHRSLSHRIIYMRDSLKEHHYETYMKTKFVEMRSEHWNFEHARNFSYVICRAYIKEIKDLDSNKVISCFPIVYGAFMKEFKDFVFTHKRSVVEDKFEEFYLNAIKEQCSNTEN